jgi:hypothetical protein
MSFDMTRLRTNYGPDNGWVEVEGPNPPHEYLCGECTGSGIMLGYYPCKPCRGIGYIVPESVLKVAEDILDQSKTERQEAIHDFLLFGVASVDVEYPNERELNLLNNRISLLKAQLSKELQKKKSERSDIKQLQQSINTLTKWKLQSKNSMQTAS